MDFIDRLIDESIVSALGAAHSNCGSTIFFYFYGADLVSLGARVSFWQSKSRNFVAFSAISDVRPPIYFLWLCCQGIWRTEFTLKLCSVKGTLSFSLNGIWQHWFYLPFSFSTGLTIKIYLEGVDLAPVYSHWNPWNISHVKVKLTPRKHTYIILTHLNSTFI